jgi:hypothetical protein
MNRRKLWYPVIAICVAVLVVVALAVYVSRSPTNSSSATYTTGSSCNLCVSVLQYAYPGEELGFNVTVSGLSGSPAFWNVTITYPNDTLLPVGQVYQKLSSTSTETVNLASTQPASFFWEFPLSSQAPAGSYSLTVRAQLQDNVYHDSANFTVPQLNAQPGG